MREKLAAENREFWKVKGGKRGRPMYRNAAAGGDKLFVIMKRSHCILNLISGVFQLKWYTKKRHGYRFLREASLCRYYVAVNRKTVHVNK